MANAGGFGMTEAEKSKLELDAAKAAAGSVPRSNVLRYSTVRQIIWRTVVGTKFGPLPAPSEGRTAFMCSP
jgi:hypothetical protein